jgi:hypothetical protein
MSPPTAASGWSAVRSFPHCSWRTTSCGTGRRVSGHDGEIEVAGPSLARSLTKLGLIDEYRICLHPVVLGRGAPCFAGPRPQLRLVAHDRIDEDVIRLAYVPVWFARGAMWIEGGRLFRLPGGLGTAFGFAAIWRAGLVPGRPILAVCEIELMVGLLLVMNNRREAQGTTGSTM